MTSTLARGMATTRHRSLVGRSGRKALVRDKGLAHTQKGKGKKKCQKKRYLESKKRFWARRASSKTARLFLTK